MDKTDKTQETAIKIVKTIKTIVETVLEDIENKKSFNELFPYCFPFLGGGSKENRELNLELFDNSTEYYKDLLKYFNYYLRSFYITQKKNIVLFKSTFAITNFSSLTDLLLEILKNNEQSYKDDIIKFDITILCGIFAEKNRRLIDSDSFFLICVNELKRRFNKSIETNDFIKKLDNHYKLKASKILQKVKGNLYNYIKRGFYEYLKIKENKKTKDKSQEKLNKEYEELELMKKTFNKFQEVEDLATDLNFLKKFCLNECYTYFLEYSKYLTKVLGYDMDEEKQKSIFDNFILPFGVLDIEINEKNAKIICQIKYNECEGPDDILYLDSVFYQQFINIRKEIDFISVNNYKTEIENLIYKDNNFMINFYSIITSEPVSSYLKSGRKYDKKNPYLVHFIIDGKIDNKNKSFVNYLNDIEEKNDLENKKMEEPEQCLKSQYEQFLKDITNNFEKFRNLIRIKELCYKIPALCGPSMRIFINPILEFSEEAKNDEAQRKSILKSALIILLVHEIAHLLKYYPVEKKYPSTMPSTPNGRENGKCLIYYLFGTDLICKINYNQSCEINNIRNWNDIKFLKKIFKNEHQNSLYNNKLGELDFYFSNKEDDNDDKKMKKQKKNEYCFW